VCLDQSANIASLPTFTFVINGFKLPLTPKNYVVAHGTASGADECLAGITSMAFKYPIIFGGSWFSYVGWRSLAVAACSPLTHMVAAPTTRRSTLPTSVLVSLSPHRCPEATRAARSVKCERLYR